MSEGGRAAAVAVCEFFSLYYYHTQRVDLRRDYPESVFLRSPFSLLPTQLSSQLNSIPFPLRSKCRHSLHETITFDTSVDTFPRSWKTRFPSTSSSSGHLSKTTVLSEECDENEFEKSQLVDRPGEETTQISQNLCKFENPKKMFSPEECRKNRCPTWCFDARDVR